MPFETPTLPALVSRVQADLAGDALRQSDAQVMARVLGGTAYGLYGYLQYIAAQALPDTAEIETLERMAKLRLNQARKDANPAAGGVTFTAGTGAVLDVDTVLQSKDGRSYKITAGVTTVAGTNASTVEAVDAGVLGNAEAGMELTLVQPVEGVGSAFVVGSDGLTGGTAQESVESLRARVVRSYQVIPHGGNADDYETWALECAGVTRAWTRRAYLGPGTVGLFFMRDDDADPFPDAEQVAVVQAYIEAARPVTAEVFALSPNKAPVAYQIKLSPDTSVVRAAVVAQLVDLHAREAGLGDSLLISHIREAISSATGEKDYRMDFPLADVVPEANQVLTYGGVEWLP